MNLVEVEFQAWPKTPRMFRECTITEKIDGTNAAVVVPESGPIYAQSRKRIITPDDDNAGFAAWVRDNAAYLGNTLGPGRHFGEWWGRGIQRGYGMSRRVFSLFNTHKWRGLAESDEANEVGLSVVPELYVGPFDTDNVRIALAELDVCGSQAAPGFMYPEGVCVWHSASRQIYKALIENDHEPKSVRFDEVSRAGRPDASLALVA